MISLISSLLQLLVVYFELQNKLFYYDIHEKSRKRQKELAEEIERLRSIGNHVSTDNADILRSELLAEKARLKHLSAFYFKTSSESTDKNS